MQMRVGGLLVQDIKFKKDKTILQYILDHFKQLQEVFNINRKHVLKMLAQPVKDILINRVGNKSTKLALSLCLLPFCCTILIQIVMTLAEAVIWCHVTICHI